MTPVTLSNPIRSAPNLIVIAATALLVGTGGIVLFAGPSFSQTAVVVDVREVAKGYRASQLTGSTVQNNAGDEIGKIDDLIVDRQKVLFAVLQVGGFLGLGGHLVAVPFGSLQISEDGRKIMLPQGSKDDLQKMPEFKYLAA
jgi:sporulation protein YlmC with PRC-barrel domain